MGRVKMDKGPFTVTAGDITGKIRIDSDDFTHDASLVVYGDFADDDDRIKYARFIADELNSCAALRARCERLEKVAEAARGYLLCPQECFDTRDGHGNDMIEILDDALDALKEG